MEENTVFFGHHSRVIDEFDMQRMIDKVEELEKIKQWLRKLETLDKTVNFMSIEAVIAKIEFKQDQLNKKLAIAKKDMIEEAELMAKIYE